MFLSRCDERHITIHMEKRREGWQNPTDIYTNDVSWIIILYADLLLLLLVLVWVNEDFRRWRVGSQNSNALCIRKVQYVDYKYEAFVWDAHTNVYSIHANKMRINIFKKVPNISFSLWSIYNVSYHTLYCLKCIITRRLTYYIMLGVETSYFVEKQFR